MSRAAGERRDRGRALSARRRGAQPPFRRAAPRPRAHGRGARFQARERARHPARRGLAPGSKHFRFSSPALPHQGRTLRTADTLGMPLDFYFGMEQAPSMLQRYAAHRGARIQRIDHLNCFTPDVQASYDFYAGLGFRLTEYTETEDADAKLWAVWMHRKGNVHDLAFTNGAGPRLHHVGMWVAGALDILHICDVMATSGYLPNMERGPGRHGISNAFFLYVRDPDGHRIELFTSDYLTVDPDLAPIRWTLRDPQRQTLWGHPAPKSWFEEGTIFAGVPTRAPALAAQPIVAR